MEKKNEYFIMQNHIWNSGHLTLTLLEMPQMSPSYFSLPMENVLFSRILVKIFFFISLLIFSLITAASYRV